MNYYENNPSELHEDTHIADTYGVNAKYNNEIQSPTPNAQRPKILEATQYYHMPLSVYPLQQKSNNRKNRWLTIITGMLILIIVGCLMATIIILFGSNDTSDEASIVSEIKSSKIEEDDKGDTDTSDVSADLDSDIGHSDESDTYVIYETKAPEVSMDDVSDVTASSYLIWEYNGKTWYYPPEQLIDGDITLSWQEGVEGFGVSESVTIWLNNNYTVSGFNIYNGFQESQSLYYENGRPTKLLVSFSDSTSTTVELEDEFGVMQTFTFDEPVETNSVTFEILDIAEGSRYYDTAISEIELF